MGRLLPSGSKRVMVAQSFLPGEDFAKQTDILPLAEDQSTQPVSEPEPAPKVEEIDPQSQSISDENNVTNTDESDESEYVFKLLTGFGYPPRRLEEFSDKFVKEKIYPGGVREIQLVIPDKYYGMRKRISDKDVAKVVEDMQRLFGLTFIDAQRENKNLTMNFSSQKPQTDEEVVAGDELDEVYGGGASKKPTKKQAQTMAEMMKTNRNSLFEELIKRLARD